MPDSGAHYTDRQIADVESRITALYETAYSDINRKYMAFVKKFLRDDAKYRQKLKDGEITKATYDAWLRGQVFQKTRWEAQLDDLAQTLTHTTQTAMGIINDAAPGVFAMNANYAEYEIEHEANIDMGFGLYDEDAVRRLVRDDPNLLPPSKVNIPIEQQWNRTLINRQIGVGIVSGEGIEAIAKRLQRAANMSANQARTHARTAMTGAQNAGRIEGYHRAQDMGIQLEKEWLATLDNHTRHAHAALDGQHVPVDEPFQSELGEIMYPGDRNARPANVYNCRCTLISHLLEYPSENAKRRPNLQEYGDALVQKPIKDMTYAQWAKWKTGIANKASSGIIEKTKDQRSGVNVKTVGKIDTKIYNVIGEILTDEVVMTDERVKHIKERHPNDYERFFEYIPYIISEPDYIIEANKENTAVVLKEIEDNGEKFKLILRIKVVSDPPEYKNSVISFWHVGETTWRKTIKNKNILYKKE